MSKYNVLQLDLKDQTEPVYVKIMVQQPTVSTIVKTIIVTSIVKAFLNAVSGEALVWMKKKDLLKNDKKD